jgi:hypothetical protein
MRIQRCWELADDDAHGSITLVKHVNTGMSVKSLPCAWEHVDHARPCQRTSEEEEIYNSPKLICASQRGLCTQFQHSPGSRVCILNQVSTLVTMLPWSICGSEASYHHSLSAMYTFMLGSVVSRFPSVMYMSCPIRWYLVRTAWEDWGRTSFEIGDYQTNRGFVQWCAKPHQSPALCIPRVLFWPRHGLSGYGSRLKPFPVHPGGPERGHAV